jgi:dolichol-phosphate mannosyltransferase
MTQKDRPSLLSVVVPVYGSPQSLEPLRDRLAAACAQLGVDHELILVDDRCPRDSWAVVRRLAETDPNVVGVRLSRNFGQHAAINAGLARVRGDWVVVMDCDLQDQPEEIPKLLHKAWEGGFDIVRAQRADRNDPWRRKFASWLFYRVLSFLTDTNQSEDIGNFGVYRRKVIDAMNAWQEESKYFRALVEWIGFSHTVIPVAHASRHEGKSSYNLRKLVRLATNVIIGFSDRPLKLMMATGFGISSVAFVIGFGFVVARLAGLIGVEGWTSVILSLWFLSGVILFGMGLTGLYVGRILIEAKGRPTFVIDQIVAGGSGSEALRSERDADHV